MFVVHSLISRISSGFKVYAGQSLARGWGESIKWLTLEEGESNARTNNKPIIVIIHKPTCTACAALKRRFAVSPGIRELSKYFVMINLEPCETSDKPDLYPDGKYVPRIMFFTPRFALMTDIQGLQAQYKYFYDDEADVEANMRRVLNRTF